MAIYRYTINIYMLDSLLNVLLLCSLRKVKMDQRKLMDNANTITDMAKVCSRHNVLHSLLKFEI